MLNCLLGVYVVKIRFGTKKNIDTAVVSFFFFFFFFFLGGGGGGGGGGAGVFIYCSVKHESRNKTSLSTRLPQGKL